jgi:ubiquinone/menaquinone biosynthesis C-methylase UbiE
MAAATRTASDKEQFLAELSLQQIEEYWTQQALAHGQSPSASWSDRQVIHMEIAEILKYLQDGDRVLDIGCANGYSTVQFARQRAVDILGLDYIPEMVQQANDRVVSAPNLSGRIRFQTGDITALALPDQSFDKVVVIRVVINLVDWDRQLRGLLEAVRVLKRGGLLLLSEATMQGHRMLNTLRREWGLPDIPVPAFNTYLDQDQVVRTRWTWWASWTSPAHIMWGHGS